MYSQAHTKHKKQLIVHTVHGVKGAIELGISSCEGSDVEEVRPDALEEAMKDTTGWVDLDGTNNIPKNRKKGPSNSK